MLPQTLIILALVFVPTLASTNQRFISGHFKKTTKTELGMGITDPHVVSYIQQSTSEKIVCPALCAQRQWWCDAYWYDKENNQCTMVSENVNVWTNDRAEWFGNDEIPIEESLYAPLDVSTRPRAYALHLEYSGDGDKNVLVRGDGSVCPADLSRIPPHPDEDVNSARMIVRNGYAVYSIGTGIHQHNGYKLDLTEEPRRWASVAGLPAGRYCFGLAIERAVIWLFGGQSPAFLPLNSVLNNFFPTIDQGYAWGLDSITLLVQGCMDAVYYSPNEIWLFDQSGNAEKFDPIGRTQEIVATDTGIPGTGHTVDFEYIELDDGRKGFVGVQHNVDTLRFLNKDTSTWESLRSIQFHGAAPVNSNCVAAMTNNMVYISGPTEWVFFNGKDNSVSQEYPDNSGAGTGLDLAWGPCAAVSKAFFPKC